MTVFIPRIINLLNTQEKLGQITTKVALALESLESWMVLPWSNQLLSLLQEERLQDFIYPMVLKMSQNYPQALWFAFNFVDAKVKTKYAKLASALEMPPLMKTFAGSLEKISLPLIRTIDFIDRLIDSADPEKLMKQFELTNFSSNELSRAEEQFFKPEVCQMLRNLVDDIKFVNDEGKRKKICAKYKEKLPKKNQNITKMDDLSKFLQNFAKHSHAETLEVPGQYEMKFRPVDAGKTVKIGKCFKTVYFF